MAAGDLLSADGQVEAGGEGRTPLLIGGTGYLLDDWDLMPGASVDGASVQLAGAGVAQGLVRLGGVLVTVAARTRDADGADVVAGRAALAAVFRPAIGLTEDYLAWMAGGAKYLMFGQMMGGETDTSAVGWPHVARFAAAEPTYYSCTVTSDTVDDSTTVTNAGTVATGWEITLTPGSSVVGPYWRRGSDPDVTIKYDGTVTAGQTLRINTRTLVAVKDGTDVSGHLSDGQGNPPAWWRLLPGANTVHYGSTSGSSTVPMTHRSGYAS